MNTALRLTTLLVLLSISCVALSRTASSRSRSSYSSHSRSTYSSHSRSHSYSYHPRSYSTRSRSSHSYTHHPRTYTSHPPRTYSRTRSSNHERPRSEAAKDAFKRQHPCPSTGKSSGACPGYVIDHVNPLACGGLDAPSNMQWQTVSQGKAKDKVERKGCR